MSVTYNFEGQVALVTGGNSDTDPAVTHLCAKTKHS